jgi:hypothetical protein
LYKFNTTHPALGGLSSGTGFDAKGRATGRRGLTAEGDCLTYINQNAEVKKLSVVVIAEIHNSAFVKST